MDQSFDHLILAALSYGLVLYFIYRRFRRTFGRQKLSRGRLRFRLTLFWFFGVVLLLPALFSMQMVAAVVAGAAVGVGLGRWGAKHTRFQKVDETLYYLPHTYAGMVVTALFLGRLLYKFVAGTHSALSIFGMGATPMPGEFGGLGSLYHNPLTFLLFFTYVSYYLYYYSYVLHESKHLKPEDWEQPEAPAVSEQPKPPAAGNA